MHNVAFRKSGKRFSSYEFHHRKCFFVEVNAAKVS